MKLGKILVALATFSLLVILGFIIAGCGGSGGGGQTSPFVGNWDGVWSDAGGGDTGFFNARASDSGSLSGEASSDVCHNTGKLSGKFTSDTTELKMDFRENTTCYSYKVVATGDELSRYDRGYATTVVARFYDRHGGYVDSVNYGIYVEDVGSGRPTVTVNPMTSSVDNTTEVVEQLKR